MSDCVIVGGWVGVSELTLLSVVSLCHVGTHDTGVVPSYCKSSVTESYCEPVSECEMRSEFVKSS